MNSARLKYFDDLKVWIIKLEVKENQWHAIFFPYKVVIANSLEYIIDELFDHISHEIVILSCDALNVNENDLKSKGRFRQNFADKRFAIANILYQTMKHKTPLRTMASLIGFRSHDMILHAVKQKDVHQVKEKIELIYSAYPFIKNSKELL